MDSYRGVVALDGPSGTGKSTVARKLAQRLDTRYLDTGAMYRAATLAVLRAAADPNYPEAVVKVVAHSVIAVSTDPVPPAVWLDGEPVDAEIRGFSRHAGRECRVRGAGTAHAPGGGPTGADRRRRHRRRGPRHRLGRVAPGRRPRLPHRQRRDASAPPGGRPRARDRRVRGGRRHRPA